jgi:hypothetical protein
MIQIERGAEKCAAAGGEVLSAWSIRKVEVEREREKETLARE